MKKTFLFAMLLTFVFSGVAFAQLPGSDKKEKKTDLTEKVPLEGFLSLNSS